MWYEAYLLTNDETSPANSSGFSTPATPKVTSGARRPSNNFEHAPIATAGLNTTGLKKSRKVYCYISKKVCPHYLMLVLKRNLINLLCCCLEVNYCFTKDTVFLLAITNQRILHEDYPPQIVWISSPTYDEGMLFYFFFFAFLYSSLK